MLNLFQDEVNPKVVLDQDGLVLYYPNFLDSNKSQFFFETFKSKIDWKQDVVTMFGKKITTQRRYAWYGDQAFNYRYSGQDRIALPWTEALFEIKEKTEKFLVSKFNCCLMNFYASGEEGMSWHSDDEKVMRAGAPIASISVGAARKFSFKHKENKELKKDVMLENGSLLAMLNETQAHYLHALPKTKRVQDPRINLTFRVFEEE